jgi:hypothetical protein
MTTYGKPLVPSATCSLKTNASNASSPQDTNPNYSDMLQEPPGTVRQERRRTVLDKDARMT